MFCSKNTDTLFYFIFCHRGCQLIVDPALYLIYIELCTETNLETLTLILKPPIVLPLGRSIILGLGLEITAPNIRFFLFGLGLGYIIVCDVKLLCVNVRTLY